MSDKQQKRLSTTRDTDHESSTSDTNLPGRELPTKAKSVPTIGGNATPNDAFKHSQSDSKLQTPKTNSPTKAEALHLATLGAIKVRSQLVGSLTSFIPSDNSENGLKSEDAPSTSVFPSTIGTDTRLDLATQLNKIERIQSPTLTQEHMQATRPQAEGTSQAKEKLPANEVRVPLRRITVYSSSSSDSASKAIAEGSAAFEGSTPSTSTFEEANVGEKAQAVKMPFNSFTAAPTGDHVPPERDASSDIFTGTEPSTDEDVQPPTMLRLPPVPPAETRMAREGTTKVAPQTTGLPEAVEEKGFPEGKGEFEGALVPLPESEESIPTDEDAQSLIFFDTPPELRSPPPFILSGTITPELLRELGIEPSSQEPSLLLSREESIPSHPPASLSEVTSPIETRDADIVPVPLKPYQDVLPSALRGPFSSVTTPIDSDLTAPEESWIQIKEQLPATESTIILKSASPLKKVSSSTSSPQAYPQPTIEDYFSQPSSVTATISEVGQQVVQQVLLELHRRGSSEETQVAERRSGTELVARTDTSVVSRPDTELVRLLTECKTDVSPAAQGAALGAETPEERAIVEADIGGIAEHELRSKANVGRITAAERKAKVGEAEGTYDELHERAFGAPPVEVEPHPQKVQHILPHEETSEIAEAVQHTIRVAEQSRPLQEPSSESRSYEVLQHDALPQETTPSDVTRGESHVEVHRKQPESSEQLKEQGSVLRYLPEERELVEVEGTITQYGNEDMNLESLKERPVTSKLDTTTAETAVAEGKSVQRRTVPEEGPCETAEDLSFKEDITEPFETGPAVVEREPGYELEYAQPGLDQLTHEIRLPVEQKRPPLEHTITHDVETRLSITTVTPPPIASEQIHHLECKTSEMEAILKEQRECIQEVGHGQPLEPPQPKLALGAPEEKPMLEPQEQRQALESSKTKPSALTREERLQLEHQDDEQRLEATKGRPMSVTEEEKLHLKAESLKQPIESGKPEWVSFPRGEMLHVGPQEQKPALKPTQPAPMVMSKDKALHIDHQDHKFPLEYLEQEPISVTGQQKLHLQPQLKKLPLEDTNIEMLQLDVEKKSKLAAPDQKMPLETSDERRNAVTKQQKVHLETEPQKQTIAHEKAEPLPSTRKMLHVEPLGQKPLLESIEHQDEKLPLESLRQNLIPVADEPRLCLETRERPACIKDDRMNLEALTYQKPMPCVPVFSSVQPAASPLAITSAELNVPPTEPGTVTPSHWIAERYQGSVMVMEAPPGTTSYVLDAAQRLPSEGIFAEARSEAPTPKRPSLIDGGRVTGTWVPDHSDTQSMVHKYSITKPVEVPQIPVQVPPYGETSRQRVAKSEKKAHKHKKKIKSKKTQPAYQSMALVPVDVTPPELSSFHSSVSSTASHYSSEAGPTTLSTVCLRPSLSASQQNIAEEPCAADVFEHISPTYFAESSSSPSSSEPDLLSPGSAQQTPIPSGPHRSPSKTNLTAGVPFLTEDVQRPQPTKTPSVAPCVNIQYSFPLPPFHAEQGSVSQITTNLIQRRLSLPAREPVGPSHGSPPFRLNNEPTRIPGERDRNRGESDRDVDLQQLMAVLLISLFLIIIVVFLLALHTVMER
ncbi:titin-like [Ornithodoros turicata]|uniref:titin-like n=1 Tax=Ornithodoros turicata TaxID=34597 RepID=UPI003138BF3D